MPRGCSVCAHPERRAIDAALARVGGAQSFRAIARQFGLGRDALRRHMAHILQAVPPVSPTRSENAPENAGGMQGGANRSRGRFRPGQSGNPAGRPPGALNAATRVAEQLLAGNAEAVVRKLLEKALAGDSRALAICAERILPGPRRDRPVSLDLPPQLATASDVVDALRKLYEQVCSGRITTNEGEVLARLLDGVRAGIETGELEARLRQLETAREARRR